MEEVYSTLVSESETVLVKSIPTKKIIHRYKVALNIDVKRFFKNISKVELLECKDSKFQFFYPLTVDGDSKFYEDLSNSDWYYMPWKWEHQETLAILKPHYKVLEIGSAQGSFLKEIKKVLEHSPVGLELNKKAVELSIKKGLQVKRQTIEDFSKNHIEEFDVVCSFQVVEHVAQIKSFLKSQIECLKPGGILIISVPNNDSFIKDDPFPLLNMPPHHMGRWTPESLKYLTNIFPIILKEIKFEPFQDHHIDYFLRMKVYKKLKSWFLTAILFKLKIHKILYPAQKIKNKLKDIPGHSIMAVFEKK